MDALDICLVTAAYCTGMLGVLLWGLAKRFSRSKVLLLVTILCSIVATCIVGTTIQSGQSFDLTLWQLVMAGKPKTIIIVATGFFVGVAWGFVELLGQSKSVPPRIARLITPAATFCLTFTGLLLAWEDAFDIERFRVSVLDDSFIIEELVRTEEPPVRLALNDESDTLYFSTYSTGINGVYGGSIFAMSPVSKEVGIVPRLAATSPLLYRTFGMTCFDGDLYVSRAGHAAHASNGSVTYSNAGAVTRLRDLDGDGQFEFLHDVLTDLPAARGPDTMHQNNGVVFDSLGNLFVAVGSADNRSLDQHPWSGTILKQTLENTQPEVFARGLRNPFGICCGNSGALFVTDNDCSEDPGDEVNFVVQGSHSGHPYQVPGEQRVSGFSDSIIPPDPNSNYCGIAFLPDDESSGSIGNVYVCDRLSDCVIRLKIQIHGELCNVIEKQTFARIPSPVDVVVSSTGDLFVASLGKQKIYRIHRK